MGLRLIHLDLIAADMRSAFERRVREIAGAIDIDPNWLMQVMYAESKLKPGAANRQEGRLIAAGLLQFTKASGILKTGFVSSLEEILGMSYLKQLDLVLWYFKPWNGKMHGYHDVYAVTFFPALVGKPDNWVLQTKTLSAAKIARQNPAVSKGKSAITVAMFKTYVVNSVPKSLREIVFGATAGAVKALAESGPGRAVSTAAGQVADATRSVAATVAKNAGTTTLLTLVGVGGLLFF